MTHPERDGRHPIPQRAFDSREVPPRALGQPSRALDGAAPVALSGGSRARRGWVDARSFSRSAGWTLLSTIIPGLGLAKTRWRGFGWFLTGIAVAFAGVVAVAAFFARGAVLSGATNPLILTGLWVGLAAFGVLWLVAIVATHLLTRPKPPTGWQRTGGAALVGILAFAVAVPTFVGARSIYDTATLIRAVFQDAEDPGGVPAPDFGNAVDPWANKPRLNVLILGGDAGPDRDGTRTDTVIVASINTKTGDTVLYALPRQTQRMPFPAGSDLAKAWPRGYYAVDAPEESQLNAMYMNVPRLTPKAIPEAKDPGAKVLQIAVGEALGLKIDYYAMVNLEGFVELINALGGVTVNINKAVPVGGRNANPPGAGNKVPPDRWLAPGPNQHLNGYDALWFARARYEVLDYERMARQRCVIQAVTQQVNLATVLTNYEALTKAGTNIIATDVPNSLLPALLDLAGKVRQHPMRSIAFENNKDGFSTVTPNWTLVRRRVQEGLDPASAPTPQAPESADPSDAPSATPSGGRATSTNPAPTTKSTSTAPADPTHNVEDDCAYDPAAWERRFPSGG